MKKKVKNSVHLEGYLYESNLQKKISGPNATNPNVEYITGTISIATDDDCTNIVPVHYTYVTATTSTGKTNPAFAVLSNIVDEKYKSVMTDGKENATKFRIDSSIGLNEFFTDKNGKEELVTVKRNEGGFIHVTDILSEKPYDRNNFECDMLITGAKLIEADEEKNIPEKVEVKGAIFDFRGALLPVDFSISIPGGMDYFLGLEASNQNPVFTNIKGQQVSQTIVRTIVEESAFGDDYVREVKTTRKDFVITGSAKEPYVWDDEETITAKELTEKIAARETYLATLKQRNDEYKAQKANPVAAMPSNTDFKF